MAARKKTPKRTTARKRAPEGAPPPKPGEIARATAEDELRALARLCEAALSGALPIGREAANHALRQVARLLERTGHPNTALVVHALSLQTGDAPDRRLTTWARGAMPWVYRSRVAEIGDALAKAWAGIPRERRIANVLSALAFHRIVPPDRVEEIRTRIDDRVERGELDPDDWEAIYGAILRAAGVRNPLGYLDARSRRRAGRR